MGGSSNGWWWQQPSVDQLAQVAQLVRLAQLDRERQDDKDARDDVTLTWAVAPYPVVVPCFIAALQVQLTNNCRLANPSPIL